MKLPQATKLFKVTVTAELYVAAPSSGEAEYAAVQRRHQILDDHQYDFQFDATEFPRAHPGTKITSKSYTEEFLHSAVICAESVKDAVGNVTVPVLAVLEHMQTVDETIEAVNKHQLTMPFEKVSNG